jgi:hypothetical protein
MAIIQCRSRFFCGCVRDCTQTNIVIVISWRRRHCLAGFWPKDSGSFPLTAGEFGSVKATIRTLRAVEWAMLGSIVLHGVVGEVVGSGARAADPSLGYVFTSAGVAIVGVIFVRRRTLVLRSPESLASHPDDSLTLSHWRAPTWRPTRCARVRRCLA